MIDEFEHICEKTKIIIIAKIWWTSGQICMVSFFITLGQRNEEIRVSYGESGQNP